MGQPLTKLAKACDCFEVPWQVPEDQSSAKEERTVSSSHSEQPQIPTNLQLFNQKEIIFQAPVSDDRSKNQSFESLGNTQEMKWAASQLSHYDQQEKESKQSEISVIDLDKITPQIRADALRRAQVPRKVRKFPLIVHTFDEDEQTESNVSEEALSNMFEERGRYFIENDEAEYEDRVSRS